MNCCSGISIPITADINGILNVFVAIGIFCFKILPFWS